MARSPDFLVLGLGNPGERYEGTRHNFGARVVLALARSAGTELGGQPGPCRLALVELEGVCGVLAVPRVYMNRSGDAALALRGRFPDLSPARFLVAHDDLDLPLGRIRFRPGGGDGGHRGIRSILESLGEEGFPRLRLGVGRPPGPGEGAVEHVLDRFGEEEERTVDEVVDRAVRGVKVFAAEGVGPAMNRFNTARPEGPPDAGGSTGEIEDSNGGRHDR